MEKEEKLFSVQSSLNDQDYDEVFRMYLEMERGNEKKIAMIICAVLFVICMILFFINSYNIMFIFYGIGCLVVGAAYLLVPVNKKFLATNRLMYGMNRETGFYPHSLTTMEIFEDEDAAEMTPEEIEDATTEFSTGSIKAFENENGFLFAEGKISNQFLYIPKRGLDEQTEENIRGFARERCSGGYQYLEMKSMLEPEDAPEDAQTGSDSLVNEVCDQYYGKNRLHLYDEEGNPIDPDDGDKPADEIADGNPDSTAEADDE